MGKFLQAIDVLERLKNENYMLSEIFAAQGFCLMYLKRYTGAKRRFSEAILLEKSNKHTRSNKNNSDYLIAYCEYCLCDILYRERKVGGVELDRMKEVAKKIPASRTLKKNMFPL